MRLYAPAPVEAVLDGLLADPAIASAVVAHQVLPARVAITASFPEWLAPPLRAGLERQGLSALYRHQADALEALRAGRDVLVVTPTASGKSLCYHLPVLQAVVEDPAARALYLFPTKALSQDQLAALEDLARAAEVTLAAGVYDGDTPAPRRTVLRSAGQVVMTNPDMLHAAILPHHTKWFQLFEHLRYVVIDEAHTYRGVFGSHVANVLRRLLRLCAHYGSSPQLIVCSATIGNPLPLAETLTGRSPVLVERNGAPSGRKHVVVLDPPLLDEASGARASAFGLAERSALAFLRAGRQTVVFGRSRTGVELLLTRLREALRDRARPACAPARLPGRVPAHGAARDRGWPARRDVLGVVSTNALELGLDIGRLDVAVLAGYPGSIAATWQQMGRAGRRQEAVCGDPRGHRRAARPVRRPSPRVPPRGHARGGPPRPREPARPARPPARGDLRAALRAGGALRHRSRPTTCWPSWPRRATCARPTMGAGTGRARTSRPPRSPCARQRPRTWSSSTPPATGPASSARSTSSPRRRSSMRARSTSTSRASTMSTGLTGTSARPTCGRSTSTTTRRPSWQSRSSRSRRFAMAEAPAAERAHGEVMVCEHRHHLQEAALRDAREPGLGTHPPARDRAAYDRLLDRVRARGPCRPGRATTWSRPSSAPDARCRPWPACC